MKWIARVGTFFTILNSFLTGMEMAYPSKIKIKFSIWSMEHVLI